jgi:hypothetical protein
MINLNTLSMKISLICVLHLSLEWSIYAQCQDSMTLYHDSLPLITIKDSSVYKLFDRVIQDESINSFGKDSVLFVVTSFFNNQENHEVLSVDDPFYKCFAIKIYSFKLDFIFGYCYYKNKLFIIRRYKDQFKYPFEQTSQYKKFSFPIDKSYVSPLWGCGDNGWEFIPLGGGKYSYFHRNYRRMPK